MAFNVGSQGTLTFLKMAYVDKVLRPHEMTNQFTVESEQEAADILDDAGVKFEEELKAMILGLDMTAISTRELATLGSKLCEAGLINSDAASLFIEGNRDCDNNGQSIGRDVKFNAIALFNQRYEGHLEFAKTRPVFGDQTNFNSIGDDLKLSNHLLGALAYYANSTKAGLSIRVRA